MLKVDGQAFYQTLAWFVKIHQIAEHMSPADRKKTLVGSPGDAASIGLRDSIIEDATALRQELRVLGADMTSMSVSRLIDRLSESETTYTQLMDMTSEIDSRTLDELSLISLFVLDRDRAKYFDSKEPVFGQAVADHFPSSNYDIDEAGKCLAVRRSTACVAHLMRALEPALNCLATVFNVPFAHTNWHNILDQIEKEIRTRAATPPPNWKADEQFYSEAAAHFRLLKDAWRNHTMHLRDRYDEERAEAIFQNVRAFMRHLSTRLSETAP